ncbi:MAG TPA: class I adenylate-forming enzyme family protein [Steroidobacteraceae bacterium]|nr:class I adenylate-forming enzyme family protein [Steroidobacteraceae bacterium]
MPIGLDVGTLAEPFSGRRWDRTEMHRQTGLRIGRFQGLGLAEGDRVLVMFGNCLEFFAELLAIWKCGACAIPVDSRLTAFEVRNLSATADARFAVVDADTQAEIVATLVESGLEALLTTEVGTTEGLACSIRQDSDALILFTSGSTGDPKGVIHTHRSLGARWMGLRAHLPEAAFARSLCMLPTHFGHGLICNCLFPWLSGNDLYITPSFRPDLVTRLGSVIDEHRITFMSSVPPIWKFALKLAKPPRNGSLQRVHVGSAPLSAKAWDDVRRWTGTPQVCNAYGITETGSWVAGLEDAGAPAEDGLIGTGWGAIVKVLRTSDTAQSLAPDMECRRGEPGYVWLNTPALMKGYFRRDDLTAKAVVDGWFMTGDVGRIDDQGRLILCGRERDEINKGGMKIYPSDIDAVVERFAAASDVCTFAMDDPIYGQAAGMAVVLSDTGDSTVRELYEWMKSHLAEHKMPSRWWVVDAIPRTSRGKINRDAVKAACEPGAALDLPSILARAPRA